MQPERWAQVKEIFEGAMDLPAAQRGRFLHQQCGADAALRTEVESLLDEHDEAGEFLETPMVEEANELWNRRSVSRRRFSVGEIMGDRYKVVRLLGQGGTSMVFHAFDQRISRSVAVKTIDLGDIPDPGEREWHRERFLREAQAAGTLSHPGIVTIYDCGEHQDIAYIVMELVNGPTLEQFLAAQATLRTATLYDLLRQTASALDFAHKHAVVHRDVKPSNIMLTEDRTVKITDFGIAKILTSQTTKMNRLTAGTPYYMSPEQIQGKTLDGRSDQFSLAVIAYQILTGKNPFATQDGEKIAVLIYRIVNEAPVAAQTLNPSLGPQIEAVLCRGMAKTAADRYKTCLDFVRDLEKAGRATKGWRAARA